MQKNSGTVDKVNGVEFNEEKNKVAENLETKAEGPFIDDSAPAVAQNIVGYSPPKNGLIASALEIPNSVCMSFEHVGNLLQSTPPLCSTGGTIPQDEEHSGLFTKAQNEVSTDQEFETTKSENQEQHNKPKDVSNSSVPYNEVLIDGFAILSFKTINDLLEFTKLSESQNPGMNPMVEQTYKRARRSGVPKRKRTKAFLKQTLSQTSPSTDLLRHRRHHHHHQHHYHHNHNHYHHANNNNNDNNNGDYHQESKQPSDHHHQQQQQQHPSLYAYKSHYETSHISSKIYLSPNHETDNESLVDTTIPNGDNKISSIQSNNNHNHYHRSYEVNKNNMSLHEDTNHDDDVHYRDDESSSPPPPSLLPHHHHHQHNPYCFTDNLSTDTIITSNSPIQNTMTSPNGSHHHHHHNHRHRHHLHPTDLNRSPLITTTMPKIEPMYSPKTNRSSPEYNSLMNSINHSVGNNMTSSSHDYRFMSMPGMWNSKIKPDIISPQKTDKITYGKC
ncbi:unnamed protein product [Schistosoma turkestanicum]|nr:unnamed protein product [Schistosoma turkestanicum]